MLSYLDDLALTAASLSYRGNIRPLQELFRSIQARAVRLGISFSVLKTELIHWRIPSQRHSQLCLSPIQLDGGIIHPRVSLGWLGYWFTTTLSTSTRFSRRLALAQGAFALVRRLSPPGAGLAPYLYHMLATSLIAPILRYRADLVTPNVGSITRLNTFWHKVLRWATNCFSSTPVGILAIGFVTGPPGPRNRRAPASIPRPAPVNGLARGIFFFNPCPCPCRGPRPVQCPEQPSVNELSPPGAPLFRILPSRTLLL